MMCLYADKTSLQLFLYYMTKNPTTNFTCFSLVLKYYYYCYVLLLLLLLKFYSKLKLIKKERRSWFSFREGSDSLHEIMYI